LFLLESPQSLSLLFAPDQSPAASIAKQQEQHRIVAMLATLFVTLGEMPHIRHDGRSIASQVASILQPRLLGMSSEPGSGFPSRILSDAERPTLLLLDRSHDPLTPLLHEFTYQAMVHDLLPVNEDRYQYNYVGNNDQQITKEVLLNDSDPLWVRLRHLHIADLTELLHTEYKKFIVDNKDAADLSKKGLNMKAMASGMKSLPKFQEATARYSLHIHITTELVRKYNETSLEAIGTVEQNMATGEDSSGKPYRTALADLKDLFARSEFPVSIVDKLRLLMIYVVTQDGVKQDERRQLNVLAGIAPEDQVTILNLFYLGVTLLQGTVSSRKKRTRKLTAEAFYDVSRYVPPLKRAVEDLLSCGLSMADFPFVSRPEALHKGRTTDMKHEIGKPVAREKPFNPFAKVRGGSPGGSAAAEAAHEVPSTGRRLVVCILGGLAYSELRAMHEVGQSLGRDIIVGSTSMLTAHSYLLALKQMKQLVE